MALPLFLASVLYYGSILLLRSSSKTPVHLWQAVYGRGKARIFIDHSALQGTLHALGLKFLEQLNRSVRGFDYAL